MFITNKNRHHFQWFL